MAEKLALLLIAGVVFYFLFAFSFSTSLLSVFVLYLLTGGWRFMRIVIATFPRDARAAIYLVVVGTKMARYKRNRETTVTLFQRTLERHPDKVAMVMIDERSWTFRDLDVYSNKVANYFLEQGYKKGEVVALFMENRPEFVAIWLGLAKIGVVTALINFNLRLETLVHCITASGAKALIYGCELADAVSGAKSLMPVDAAFYCRSEGRFQPDGVKAVHLDAVIAKASDLALPRVRGAQFKDKVLYIFTSGTTGMPKPAVVTHSRFFYMSNGVFHFFKLRPDDVIYDTLPLYHTAGGVLGVGNCLLKGCTLVIRKKFSASRFWDDCIQHRCTVGQYVGELCRYLLSQPARPTDRQHQVRVVFGNGVRPQIWKEFQDRFGIERIGELYGATEGNANIINSENVPGAIGFQTRIVPWLYPVTLIKVNEDTGEPIRDHRGLCIRCEPGEPGELVGKIIKGDPMREFDGYASEEATKKKIAHNIFKQGDSYFMTGDILEMDEYGYTYFRDRMGDTFRWRGENVSTTEVEGIISNVVGFNDAVVYGVEIPGTEGRAGMAAICDPENLVDLKQMLRDLKLHLPPYACPVFIRIVNTMDVTGTFKVRKVDYRKEGYNPSVIKDKLFYLDSKLDEYRPLDKPAYEDIVSGRIRF